MYVIEKNDSYLEKIKLMIAIGAVLLSVSLISMSLAYIATNIDLKSRNNP